MKTGMQVAQKASTPANAEKTPVPAPETSQSDAPDIETQLHAARLGHSFASVGITPAPLGTIQPKLTVGAANDKYEDEADRMAGQVMRMLDAQVQRATPKEDEDKIQIKPDVQRKADGSFDAGAAAESRIAVRRGGGSPLPEATREFMEPRFGADFSGVRVHADAEADRISQDLSARAFTTGSDIYFRQGEYSPSSAGGQELLAHELTHVVQQGENRLSPAIRRKVITFSAKTDSYYPPAKDLENELTKNSSDIADSQKVMQQKLYSNSDYTKQSLLDVPNTVSAELTDHPKKTKHPPRKGIQSQIGQIGRDEFYFRTGQREAFEGGHIIGHQFWTENDPNANKAGDYTNLVPMSRTLNVMDWSDSVEDFIRDKLSDEASTAFPSGDTLRIEVTIPHAPYSLSYQEINNRFGITFKPKADPNSRVKLYGWIPAGHNVRWEHIETASDDEIDVQEGPLRSFNRIKTVPEFQQALQSTALWASLSKKMKKKIMALT